MADQRSHRARIERRDARSYGVSGAMTFDSVTALWLESHGIFAEDSVIEIDLGDVTHTDSAGLALMVEWIREATRQGGRIEFANLPDQLAALVEVANLKPVLEGKRGARH